jgi:hypothetical protein
MKRRHEIPKVNNHRFVSCFGSFGLQQVPRVFEEQDTTGR